MVSYWLENFFLDSNMASNPIEPAAKKAKQNTPIVPLTNTQLPSATPMSENRATALLLERRKSKEAVAARLKVLACELLRWSPEKAAAVTLEYMRFMDLKVKYDRPDCASSLAPSYTVDQLWHTHLLDTRSYCTLLQLLSPPSNMVMIHHNPMKAEQPNYFARLANTAYLYYEIYHCIAPAEIWNNDQATADGASTLRVSCAVPDGSVNNVVTPRSPAASTGDDFEVEIRLTLGSVLKVFAASSDTVAAFKAKILSKTGLAVDPHNYLVFAGRKLTADARTLEHYYIRHPCTLIVVPKDALPEPRLITVIVKKLSPGPRSDFESFAFDCPGPSTTIKNLLEMFEGMVGLYAANAYRLLLDGERLSEDSTLAACKAETGTCFDLMPEPCGC